MASGAEAANSSLSLCDARSSPTKWAERSSLPHEVAEPAPCEDTQNVLGTALGSGRVRSKVPCSYQKPLQTWPFRISETEVPALSRPVASRDGIQVTDLSQPPLTQCT